MSIRTLALFTSLAMLAGAPAQADDWGIRIGSHGSSFYYRGSSGSVRLSTGYRSHSYHRPTVHRPTYVRPTVYRPTYVRPTYHRPVYRPACHRPVVVVPTRTVYVVPRRTYVSPARTYGHSHRGHHRR